MSTNTELKTVLETIAAMEAQLVGLRKQLGDAGGGKAKKERKPRDPDAPKREPNEWIKFTLRVDAALKAAEQGFKRVAEGKQFAAHLKSQKAYAEWTDEEILAQRATWTPPVKAVPEPESGGESESEELRAELREVGKAALAAGEDVDAALAAAAAKKLGADGEKKRGRKPMTAEEKAAAKAAREAALAAMSPAEKEALAAKKAAAKAARAAKKGAGGAAEAEESGEEE